MQKSCGTDRLALLNMSLLRRSVSPLSVEVYRAMPLSPLGSLSTWRRSCRLWKAEDILGTLRSLTVLSSCQGFSYHSLCCGAVVPIETDKHLVTRWQSDEQSGVCVLPLNNSTHPHSVQNRKSSRKTHRFRRHYLLCVCCVSALVYACLYFWNVTTLLFHPPPLC